MSINITQSLLKQYYKLFSHEIIRFLFIGGIGFIVNFLMLTVLYHLLKMPIVIADTISAEVSLVVTFFGYNFWAFTGHHHISKRNKFLKFQISAGVGIILNISTVSILVRYAHLFYGLSLVFGTIVGLTWNYTLNKKVIFQTQKADRN
jgi:putative flippase GtrA